MIHFVNMNYYMEVCSPNKKVSVRYCLKEGNWCKSQMGDLKLIATYIVRYKVGITRKNLP